MNINVELINPSLRSGEGDIPTLDNSRPWPRACVLLGQGLEGFDIGATVWTGQRNENAGIVSCYSQGFHISIFAPVKTSVFFSSINIPAAVNKFLAYYCYKPTRTTSFTPMAIEEAQNEG